MKWTEFNWEKRIERFSIEYYLSFLVLCLLGCFLLLIHTLNNGLNAYTVSSLVLMISGIAVSWSSVNFISNKRTVTIKTVLFSKSFRQALLLLILLGVAILVNMALSNALVRLEFGHYAKYVPYLSFAVFVFKTWRSRFIFLLTLFIVGIVLGGLQI